MLKEEARRLLFAEWLVLVQSLSVKATIRNAQWRNSDTHTQVCYLRALPIGF